MRPFFALLFAILVGSCTAKTQSTPGPHSGVAYAATTPTIRFSGRCAIQTSTGTALICQDFWNRPGSELEGAVRTQCLVSGSGWANEPCAIANRFGGCKSKTDENGAYVIQWFYVDEIARVARDACEREGQSQWVE